MRTQRFRGWAHVWPTGLRPSENAHDRDFQIRWYLSNPRARGISLVSLELLGSRASPDDGARTARSAQPYNPASHLCLWIPASYLQPVWFTPPLPAWNVTSVFTRTSTSPRAKIRGWK